MLGVQRGQVKLTAYNTNWKDLFEEEKQKLQDILGDHIVKIKHIGSTSIEGLKANPVIDILVGVKNLSDVELFDKVKLKEAGYYHLSESIPEKVIFARFSDLEALSITHRLHVVSYNDSWWNRHLFFRNYLREHPEVAKEYEDFKVELASKYPNDEKAYTNEKKRFVDDILKLR